MVYCGKPSRGCQMCRTRRIKCDETKPTCNQCAKSRRVCPGYKDEFDLVFRNETQATERRARRATKRAHQKWSRDEDPTDAREVSPPPAEFVGSFTASPPGAAIVPAIVAPPQLPIADQATCHFIANYALSQRGAKPAGVSEYVVPMLQSDNIPAHYQYAFEACALASFNNGVGNRNHFEKEALGKYTKALSATFEALRDPKMAREDATLGSVLLLGLFENISAKSMGMLAWGSHIEGAIYLVKLRGREQLQTKLGREMFIATRVQMIIHSLSTSTAPPMGASWWVDDDTCASRGQMLSIKTSELRSEANTLLTTLPRLSENIEVMMDMIRRCYAHEQRLIEWCKSVPDDWKFKTVAWEDNVPGGDYSKAEVYPGRVDAYTDFIYVVIWNMVRSSRLVVGSLIVRCAAWVCAPVDYRTTPEYAHASRSAVDIVTDIIASVPYLLGWFSKRKHLLDRVEIPSFACGDDYGVKALSGYTITWPLALIHSLDYLTDSQRTWVKGRLQYIGAIAGLRYALLLKSLNVRVPSMLIFRDGLLAKPAPAVRSPPGRSPPSQQSAKSPTSPSHSILSPYVQEQELAQKEKLVQENMALIAQFLGSGNSVDEWAANSWLQQQAAQTSVI